MKMFKSIDQNQNLLSSPPFVSPVLQKKRCISEFDNLTQSNYMNHENGINLGQQSPSQFQDECFPNQPSENQNRDKDLKVFQMIQIKDQQQISQTKNILLLSASNQRQQVIQQVQQSFYGNQFSIQEELEEESVNIEGNGKSKEQSCLKKQRPRSQDKKINIKPQRNFYGYKNENRFQKQLQ